MFWTVDDCEGHFKTNENEEQTKMLTKKEQNNEEVSSLGKKNPLWIFKIQMTQTTTLTNCPPE